MENQKEDDFIFGKDESNIEFSDDVSSRKLAKLTQKVTLLSILIPCILCCIVLFIYFDITNKVGLVDSSGSAKVQSISKELEKTISQLQAKSDALEKRLNDKIKTIDKNIAGINKQMKAAEKNISFLTYSKINKKQVDSELGKINKTTAEIQTKLKSLATQNGQLVAIAEKLKVRTDELDSLKTSMNTLQTNMSETVNKEELGNSLKKQKRLFQLEIKDNVDKLNKKIALVKFDKKINSSKPRPEGTKTKTK